MRNATSWAVEIGGVELTVTVTEGPRGEPCRVAATLGPPGNPLGTALAALCESISVGLRAGVPIEAYTHGLGLHRFAPCGPTTDPLVPECCSIVDYLARAIGARWRTS